MSFRQIELHIEELVLHGFDGLEGEQVGAAVQRELERLVAEQGVPPSLAAGGEVSSLDGGTIGAASPARPGTVGAEIARAVYGGMGR